MAHRSYHKSLSRARNELARAYQKVVDVYLTQIRERYRTLEDSQKISVLDGLDDLVKAIEKELPTRKVSGISYSAGKNLTFDPKKARRIREKANIAMTKLAKELSFKNPGAVYRRLHAYERGEVKPSYPPRGRLAPKYLGWLKKHGYNPYRI